MQTKILFRIVTLTLAIFLVTACSKEVRKARLLRQGDSYFKAGDYDKAKVSYLNLLRSDQQNVTAFQQLGFIWFEQDDPFRAVPFLLKVRELAPRNIAARAKLALSLKALGQSAEARKEALSVLHQDGGNAEAIVVLADTSQTKEEIATTEEQLQKFPLRETVPFHLASASVALRKGDLEGASNEVQKALAVEPKSRQAHLAMASIYGLRKDVGQTRLELKSAADVAPMRSVERIRYADFQAANGAIDDAKASLQEVTKKAPDYFPAWISLAQIALREKKYDESLSLLENIFSRDPDDPDVRIFQTEVLLAKGDTKKAVELLERLGQAYPGAAVIKYQLARAYVQDHNTNQATAALDQAVAINPNYDDAVLLLGQIDAVTGHGDKMIEPLNRLLQRRPDLKSAALTLAAAYGSLDRFDDAVSVLHNQAEVDPSDPQPQIALGMTYRQAKRNDEARQAFEKAAKLMPNNSFAIDQLIELNLSDKHFDAARQLVRSQYQNTPNLPAAHYWEGKILVAEGKWDAAEAELQRTLELDPNFAGACDLLVQVYVATNKRRQAVSQLQALLAKNPNKTPTIMTLALVYDRMNDYPKARDAYEKLLSIQPNSVLALNNLAYLYAEHLNNLDKAYELASKARQLVGQDASVGDTFGWVLYKRSDYQQALAILQESAEKAADNPEIQFHLGMAAYMMGQTDLARAAFKKAASATKDFPGRDESKRRLALLEGGAAGSQELSVAQLEEMTKQQPNDVIAQMRLGEAYEKQGAADKAAVRFEQAVKVNPKLTAAITKLAQLNAGPLQNKEKALAYAKKARELAPADPQVAAIVGKVAYESGNFAWAYSLLQETVRNRQNDPLILHDSAWAAYSFGKVNEARDAMQKVLTNNPDPTQAADAKKFLALTALEGKSKELITAESEVQNELKSDPNYVPALMAQAALLAQRGQAKPATETYMDILHRLPDFAPAQKRLAALYAQDPSAVAAAYDLATKARKTFPDDPELSELLGRLSYEKKEYPYAIQLLQETARKRPLDADALFYLGMSQLQARQTAEARGALNQALVAGLQEPLATEAKRALADIQRE
jgi:tetratricopeptide (TPR) repeat protein